MPGDDLHFGEGEPFTLGLEEELFVVDPDDGRLINAGGEVLAALGEIDEGAIKSELHRSQVELITGVCMTVEEAVGQLSDLREAVMATGVGVIASGTHPTAVEGDSAFTDNPRYQQIRDWLGDAGATPVCALHIHVGMPDAQTAIRVFNGLRRHLPLLEALGADSPFRHGRDTGRQQLEALGRLLDEGGGAGIQRRARGEDGVDAVPRATLVREGGDAAAAPAAWHDEAR